MDEEVKADGGEYDIDSLRVRGQCATYCIARGKMRRRRTIAHAANYRGGEAQASTGQVGHGEREVDEWDRESRRVRLLCCVA